MFGGVAQIAKDPPTPSAELAVAAAGPLTSLALGGLFAVVNPLAAGSALGAIIAYLAWVNAGLAGFNLIPGFPLDGGRMLRALIWRITGSLERATLIASRTGQVVAVAFIAVGVLRAFTGGGLCGRWPCPGGWVSGTSAPGGFSQAPLSRGGGGGARRHVIGPGRPRPES